MASSSSSGSSSKSSGGIGFVGALTLVFIALKLCGKIQWSWIWVLSPIWISIILAIILAWVIFKVFGN